MRIARGAERGILVGRSERELVQVRLSDEHRARVPQTRNDRGIAIRDVEFSYARRRGCGAPFHIEQILDGDGHAVKGASIAPRGQLGVGLSRLATRLVGHDVDERIEPLVVGVNPAQARLGHFRRADFPRAELAPEFFDGEHGMNTPDLKVGPTCSRPG